jgi:glycosyltransferase involved in cell wall biosynthesis
VASDLPFARDVAGDAAVYFDPLDPCSIARSVANLIETPEQLGLLRRGALLRRERFQPHNVAEQIATVLEAAVDQEKDTHAQVGQAVC